MEHDSHPTDLLPGYAIGILDPAEQAEVAAHLESCPECRAEVAVFTEVSELLSLGVPLLVAPDELRQRVLDEAKGTAAAEGEGGRGRRGIGQALQRFFASPIWRPVAAGLILLLIISNVYFVYRLRQVESRPAGAQQTINLGATDAAPNADGILFIRQDDSTGTLVVNGLPDLGPERQYQLWLVRDGERESGAVFSVTEEGFTSVPVTGQAALPLYSRFGITIEPAGGSPGPTGDGVLRWALEN